MPRLHASRASLLTVHTCLILRLAVWSQAAKARKQEKHSSVYEAEAVLLSDDSSTQGNAHTAKPQPPVKQASPALRGTSPANTSADVPKAAPKPAPLVVRLSAPKQAQSVLEKNPKKGGTAIDSVSNDDMSTNRDHFASVKHPVSPASEASSTPHSLTVPKNTITEVTSGSDDRTPKSNRATDQEAKMQGEEDVSLGGASVYFAQQRRCAVKDREASRTLPRVPPVAEMLEVSHCLRPGSGWFLTGPSTLVNPKQEWKQLSDVGTVNSELEKSTLKTRRWYGHCCSNQVTEHFAPMGFKR